MYKKVKQLNLTDRAYLAGLIDGEGTITLAHKSKNQYRQLIITISNGDRALLEWALERVGAGKITMQRPYKNNKRWKIAHVYAISNRQALDVISQVSPYLKTYKQKRAKFVLENYLRVTPRNGKYSQKLLAQKENFTKSFFEISSPKGVNRLKISL